MEVSGQLHAPATLPPGKEPLVHIGQEAGWASELVWMQCWRENAQPLTVFKTLIIQLVAQLYTTKLSWLHLLQETKHSHSFNRAGWYKLIIFWTRFHSDLIVTCGASGSFTNVTAPTSSECHCTAIKLCKTVLATFMPRRKLDECYPHNKYASVTFSRKAIFLYTVMWFDSVGSLHC
jgi:hypothetical protein